MGDPDDGEMIGMTNNEVKKYAAVEETNGRINTHIINQEQVSFCYFFSDVEPTDILRGTIFFTWTSF
jgi:hypothetical protein